MGKCMRSLGLLLSLLLKVSLALRFFFGSHLLEAGQKISLLGLYRI